MKISGVPVYSHQIPVVRGPCTTCVGELTALETTVVKVVTDGGRVG